MRDIIPSLIWLDGWTAHKLGCMVTANPYHQTTQFVSYCTWRAGWVERYQTATNGKSTLTYDNLVGVLG